MTMARRVTPMGRADFLRGVQNAKRAAGLDPGAPLRFAAYLDQLESFTSADDLGEFGGRGDPGPFRMTPESARAAARLHTAAAKLTGSDRPANLRELAQSIADRHSMRLSDVMRLDVAAAADLSA
jgi:hypothetical protein